MKIVRSWLAEFVDLDERSDEAISDTLENLGHEVESVSGSGAAAVFDLAITANRGDALSYVGLARELAARWGIKYQVSSIGYDIDRSIKNPEIRIEDKKACPLYTARVIRGLQTKPLPSLIIERLKAVDHRLYHPAVDIANYVMEELGVPLHAFDAEKVTEPITIRRAQVGESITLLDGQTCQLEPDMLVIGDARGPIALAGIMGGRDSAVTKGTADIILEAAFFEPASIRRTRTQLGLLTSASYRFERGTDPAAAGAASDRAAALIAEHLGGKVGERIDVGTIEKRPSVLFDAERINTHLGSKLSAGEMQTILDHLGFVFTSEVNARLPARQGYHLRGEGAKLIVPSWRHDISLPDDLAEEVARVHGYDRLPRTILSPTRTAPNPDDTRWLKVEALKDRLAKSGFSEHIGSSFLSQRELQPLGLKEEDVIQLANPVSEEAAYLRPTLILSALKAIAKNPIFPDLKIFEIGTVWSRFAEGEIVDPRSEGSGEPKEHTMLTLAWTGNKPDLITSEVDGNLLGGEVHGMSVDQELLKKLKIRRPVMIAELTIETALKNMTDPKPRLSPPPAAPFRSPSRFQPALRDIAVLVDQTVTPVAVAAALRTVAHVVDVELFDQFIGGKLPRGKQSLAFHLLFEHPGRNLETKEIDGILQTLTDMLAEKFKGTLR